MMNNTIIQQGRFTADGNVVNLSIRSEVDWMMVYNVTQAAASQTTALGVKYYWQRGFPAGAKWTTLKSNAANAANLDAYSTSSGFTLLDTSVVIDGSLVSTITDISNAAIPVVTNSGTNGLSAGQTVRLINVAGAQQLGGMDFTVGRNTLSATTFSLDYMAQIVAATTITGSWRVVSTNPLFYPARRFITAITKASQAVVTVSVTHSYKVGQAVRLIVPAIYDMTEMNGLLGNVVAITQNATNNSITLDIDSSAFTTFAFPITTEVPFTFAEVVPVGEDTALALQESVDILTDATYNSGVVGMQLAGGAGNPGGAASDVMYWVAGSSFSVSNT